MKKIKFAAVIAAAVALTVCTAESLLLLEYSADMTAAEMRCCCPKRQKPRQQITSHTTVSRIG